MEEKVDPKKPPKRTSRSSGKPPQEVIVQIPLTELHPFPDHPFQIRDDDSMTETIESIREYGILSPALVRPREEGGYELISGHRRKHACELAGLAAMPVIVRDIDRDTATIIMVDSNLQRENILPSERAKAYKMKMEAVKRRAGRPEKNSPQVAANFRSDDEVAKAENVSGDTIRRYIRLPHLFRSGAVSEDHLHAHRKSSGRYPGEYHPCLEHQSLPAGGSIQLRVHHR